MNRLMIFGDSILKGVTYSAERQRYIIDRYEYEDSLSEKGLIAENCCKMGATADKVKAIVERKLDTINDETLVILGFGGNDCDFDWQSVSDLPDSEHSPHTENSFFAEQYDSIISSIKTTGARLIMTNIVPIDAEKYLQWISKNRNKSRILDYIGDPSTLYRWQEFYNLTAERLAKKYELPVIDLRKSFLLSRSYGSLLCEDGIHPSKKGHDIINELMYESVTANL